MIKPGMLIQWKSNDPQKWGWYYPNKPIPTNQDFDLFTNIFQKKRIFEQDLTEELRTKLLSLSVQKHTELAQVKNDENKEKKIIAIHRKYYLEAQEIEDKINLFRHQYPLMVIEKLVYSYKVGNTVLKERIFWKCILTKRNGEVQYIWVDDIDVELYQENSYDIKNILLKQHLARRARKTK